MYLNREGEPDAIQTCPAASYSGGRGPRFRCRGRLWLIEQQQQRWQQQRE